MKMRAGGGALGQEGGALGQEGSPPCYSSLWETLNSLHNGMWLIVICISSSQCHEMVLNV